MKAQDENNIDKFFKTGLADSENHASFRDDDWNAMEQLLDERRSKRGVIYRISYIVSGIAAILLLTLGWLYLNPTDNYKKDSVKKNTLANTSKHTGTGGRSEQHKPDHTNNALTANNQSLANNAAVSQKRKPFLSLSAANDGRLLTGKGNNAIIRDKTTLLTHQDYPVNLTGDSHFAAELAANGKMNIDSSRLGLIEIGEAPLLAQNNTDTSLNSGIKKNAIKKSNPNDFNPKPAFALAVLSAPDVNGVGSLSNSKTGVSFGIQFTVQFTKKWSISTGATYAVKPYTASPGSYINFSNWDEQPINVTANCKVLDIPVNINYQFFNKNRNSFSLGTGLSSYFMLRERYHFDYTRYAANSPYNINIKNQNKNILGVLNINATYQRQLNARFGLLLQPYYKLPLGKIGYTQSDLRSAGITVGVNWAISPFRSK